MSRADKLFAAGIMLTLLFLIGVMAHGVHPQPPASPQQVTYCPITRTESGRFGGPWEQCIDFQKDL